MGMHTNEQHRPTEQTSLNKKLREQRLSIVPDATLPVSAFGLGNNNR